MTGIEFALFLGVRALVKHLSQSSGSRVADRASEAVELRRLITFVGATNVGKSSTLNALLGRDNFAVGAGHGSTRDLAESPYESGYRLCDTPGLMDTTDFSDEVWSAVRMSELVVYATVGQLYRAETQLIERISRQQREWDGDAGTPNRRRLALYLNKQDAREAMMPRATREEEFAAIQVQVAAWIPKEYVLVGAASPVVGGAGRPARVEALEAFIRSHIAANLRG